MRQSRIAGALDPVASADVGLPPYDPAVLAAAARDDSPGAEPSGTGEET